MTSILALEEISMPVVVLQLLKDFHYIDIASEIMLVLVRTRDKLCEPDDIMIYCIMLG
jgi:hypothetical protein